MRVLPIALGLTLALVGTSFVQASSNQGRTDHRQAQSATSAGSTSYRPSGRSAFFLPPPDPAEIRRCALPEAILNSASRSACGSIRHAGASAAPIARRNSG